MNAVDNPLEGTENKKAPEEYLLYKPQHNLLFHLNSQHKI
jgi:hypothetical protein